MFELNPNLEIKKEILLESKIFIVDNFYKNPDEVYDFLFNRDVPLWKIEETSEWLYYVCFYNPFTYAVESIRFSLYSQINIEYTIGILVFTFIFLFLSILGYDPARGNLQKKGGK